MKGFLIPIYIVCQAILPALAGTEPYYHAVPAKPGDGILTLLNRYELDEHRCNLDKFLELNQLKAEDLLLEGQHYKLPVLIYTYNGKSIRTTLGITDYEKAKRIANYNRAILNRNLRQTDYESSRILWVPHHELNCSSQKNEQPVKENVPPAEVRMVSNSSIDATSIFGPAYGKVVVKSEKLRGKVYYISSGHGGPDPGAMAKIGNTQICEDEYAYDVALRLSRNLMENGATVYIVVQDKNDGIRNDDILVCDQDELTMGKEEMPVNQLQRLRQRTDAINEIYGKHAREGVKEQVLVCIHVDSRSASQRQDVFFYHFEHSKSGKKLAHAMKDVFESKYARYRPGGEYHGTVSCRNLYMLRMPFPTTLYVELANIKNEYDRKRILPSTNRQALANWLYEGLVK